MAISRQLKEERLAKLVEDLKAAEAAVITDYQGLTVRQLEDLRGKLRESGMSFTVVKNTLFLEAAKQAGIEFSELKGPAGVAFGNDDPVTTAKLVTKFAKDNEALEVVGGVVDGQQADRATIQKLSALPTREELLGRLVGSLTNPTRSLATVLSAVPRNLVYALTAVKEQKHSTNFNVSNP